MTATIALHPVLGHPKRRQVLAAVALHPGWLAREIGFLVDIAGTTASAHLLQLEGAGLIERERRDGMCLNRVTEAGGEQLALIATGAGAR